jgi:NitT/TauT family transport system permease protein
MSKLAQNILTQTKSLFYNSIVWLVFILIWFVLASLNLLNLNFVASPNGILNSLGNSKFWQVFLPDVAFSLNRIIVSLVLAFIASYLFIFVAILIPKGVFVLSRIHNLIKYIPAPVLIPIAILIFGINEQTKVAVIFFTILVLQINYLLSILEKDESKYAILQKSWRVKPVQRFRDFVLPISLYQFYRVIPSIVIWAFSIDIISEIILGGDTGLGVRIIQFQQLYNTSFLYTYLILILVLAFSTEFILINFFSRLKFDLVKTVCGVIIGLSVLFCLCFNLYSYATSLQSTGNLKVLTYKAAANLPLLVYQAKFAQNLPIDLEYTGSGLQVMDGLLSGKYDVGGYSDMPNVLSGLAKDNDLKILSQVVEKPTQPSLFFISKSGDVNNLSSLNGSTIGYYPNNLIIKQGLDFVLFSKGVRTSSVQYISSNDPNNLVQAYTSGKIQALLTIEPYAADIESQTGNLRLNQQETFVKGLNFDILPLAGLAVNTKKLSSQQIQTLDDGLVKSVEFIRQNTNSQLQPIGELKDIMQKNGLNTDSHISAYESLSEVNPENLNIILSYAKLYQVEGLSSLSSSDTKNLYYKVN